MRGHHWFAGLLFSTSALGNVSSLNLANYQLSATHALPGSAAEASAVTYNWDTGTLFVLGDEGETLVEVTTAGAVVSQMTLTGFEDTEGLTYVGGGQFVVVEERIQDVFLLTYSAGGSVDRGALPGVSLGPTVGNIGLEGISFDPLTGTYITVKEKTPQAVLEATLNWIAPSGSAADLFVPSLSVSDLSDVQVLTTVASLIGTADQDNLLIYSQESSRLMEVSRAGIVLGTFDFTAIASDAEGVTIGPDGTIYVVGEAPALYVLTPIVAPSFNGTYTQSFNGLGQSGTVTLTGIGPHAINGVLGATRMESWYGANFAGSSTNTEFKAHDGSLGSSAGRGIISYGPNASSERALGILPTSNQIPSFGIVLTNTSSDTFASLDVSFVGEQWRAGGASIPNVLTFKYGFGTSLTDATTAVSSLNFPAPILSGGEVALNGNDPTNQASLNATITNLNWAPGQSLVLRCDLPDLQGQDNGLAIDNLLLVGTPASRECPGNVVSTGTSANGVDVDDLLAVISGWGACPAPPATCPANIVNTGTSADRVDVDDLLAVISAWGPCPVN